jgi:hypothetical protein
MPATKTSTATTKRSRRRRADPALVFDPAQRVPNSMLNAILDEWLVPSLVEQFLQERGITQQSLSVRYRTLE